jgi:predicted transposase/invertase (TIGR01784 family)
MKKPLLSPLIDYVFKLIFGDQRNIDILAAFLKAALDLNEDEYSRLSIIDPHLKRESPEDKLGILDVRVQTTSGITVNVEIQVLAAKELRKRFTLYAAKMLTGQIKRGEPYGGIERVISIIIMDDILIPEEKCYYNEYGIINKRTGREFTNLLGINVLELPKLPEAPDRSRLWNWGQFFRSKTEEEFAMAAERDKDIGRAVAAVIELSEDERAEMLADSRNMFLWDHWAREQEHDEKGREEGREEERKTILELVRRGYTAEQIEGMAGV